MLFLEDVKEKRFTPLNIKEYESEEDESPRDFLKVFEVTVLAKPVNVDKKLVIRHKSDRKL